MDRHPFDFNLFFCESPGEEDSFVLEPAPFEGAAQQLAEQEGWSLTQLLWNAGQDETHDTVLREGRARGVTLLRTVHATDPDTGLHICPHCGGTDCPGWAPVDVLGGDAGRFRLSPVARARAKEMLDKQKSEAESRAALYRSIGANIRGGSHTLN